MAKCSELVLIPSEAERAQCPDLVGSITQLPGAKIQLCGWGLVQSAILTTKLIQELRPNRVWLVGIAGALILDSIPDQLAKPNQPQRPNIQLQIGRAYEFCSVEIDGIGVGQGGFHISFDELGWRQTFGGPTCPASCITLSSIKSSGSLHLLSVCSASANFEEASQRMRRYPNALAEDMESYSVASVCTQMQVPLRVFRGISNRAGDRQLARWQTVSAMQSALQLAAIAMQD